MSLADGIVLLLVACAAVAVLRFMRSQKKAGKTVFIERGRFGNNPERNGKQADRLEQYGTHDTPELTGLGKTDRVAIRVEQQRADNTAQQRNENKLTKNPVTHRYMCHIMNDSISDQ